MLQVTSPFPLFVDLKGQPLQGGRIYIGQPNKNPETFPVPVYWDLAGTQPAAQPLRTTNGYITRSGTPAAIFVDGFYSITVKDSRGRIVFSVPNTADIYGTGDVIDVSKIGGRTGSGFDNAPIINAAVAASNGKRLYFPAGTWYINSQINLPSNIEVFGDGRASIVRLGAANMSGFVATNKANVVIEDLTVQGSLVSVSAYTGGVLFDGSTKCAVRNCEFIGMTWAGVLLNNATQCDVEGNRFSAILGTLQDRADVIIYRDSNYNTIRGNHCYGGGNHGIMIQDPYTPSYPTGNLIEGNQVGGQTGNGISLYKTTAYDDNTIIANNVVRDVFGTDLAGRTGSGIFVQSGAGTIVIGNTVANCCRSTTDFDTQAVGSITVGIGNYGSGNSSPVSVIGNHIFAQRGPAIFANTSDKSILIEGNTIRSTGTSTARGEGLLVINCSHVKIHNNVIYHANPNFQALRVTSSAADFSYHQCTNNTVYANGGGGIIFNQAGGGTSSNGLVAENTVWSAGASIAYSFEKCDNYRIHGNHGESTGVVFTLTNCLRAQLTGNRFASALGTYSIIFTGTNTEGVCDESNELAGVVENDPGNGMMISQIADAAPPGSGLWAIGDRVIRRTSALASPMGWRCVANGNPGTWVSEGDLGGGGGGGGGLGQTMQTLFVNPLFDLYGANNPTVGPPVGVTTPGSCIKETGITWPKAVIAVSMRGTSSGTAIGNGCTISPGIQPYRGTDPISVLVPIRSVSMSARVVVHLFDGTNYTLIGQSTAANIWEEVKGTFTPVDGANWAIVISTWNGTSYVSGWNFFIGGCNPVKGLLPPASIETNSVRQTHMVITAAAPTLAPDFTGQRWYDTAAGKFYMAKGQTGAVDWVILN
jgi:hypothetical protein